MEKNKFNSQTDVVSDVQQNLQTFQPPSMANIDQPSVLNGGDTQSKEYSQADRATPNITPVLPDRDSDPKFETFP